LPLAVLKPGLAAALALNWEACRLLAAAALPRWFLPAVTFLAPEVEAMALGGLAFEAGATALGGAALVTFAAGRLARGRLTLLLLLLLLPPLRASATEGPNSIVLLVSVKRDPTSTLTNPRTMTNERTTENVRNITYS
jgi:hypothetical protein